MPSWGTIVTWFIRYATITLSYEQFHLLFPNIIGSRYIPYVPCKKVGFLLLQISLVTDFAVGVDVRARKYFFYRVTKCVLLETVF